MRKKLTTSILSLVLAFALLSSATFAWFSITTTVQIDDMELRVQTVGTLVLRTLDWNEWDEEETQAENFQANPRAYVTSLSAPTIEGLNNEGETPLRPSDFTRDGLEPVVFRGIDPEDKDGSTLDWDMAAAPTNNEPEDIPETENINDPQGDPVTEAIQDSGHDMFWRAVDLDEENDEYDYAQERNHYGRFDIDMVHLEQDGEVGISEENTTLNLKGETPTAEADLQDISSFGAISPEQRVEDFLSAFKVAIFEITPGEEQGDYESVGEPETESLGTMYDLIAYGQFSDAVAGTWDPAEGDDLEDTYQFDWYDDSAATTAFTDFDTFTEDEARYFTILYYIDGNAPIHNGDDQNHLGNFDFVVDIEFSVLDGE